MANFVLTWVTEENTDSGLIETVPHSTEVHGYVTAQKEGRNIKRRKGYVGGTLVIEQIDDFDEPIPTIEFVEEEIGEGVFFTPGEIPVEGSRQIIETGLTVEEIEEVTMVEGDGDPRIDEDSPVIQVVDSNDLRRIRFKIQAFNDLFDREPVIHVLGSWLRRWDVAKSMFEETPTSGFFLVEKVKTKWLRVIIDGKLYDLDSEGLRSVDLS